MPDPQSSVDPGASQGPSRPPKEVGGNGRKVGIPEPSEPNSLPGLHGPAPGAAETARMRELVLAHGERILWRNIFPLALARGKAGDWDAGRFVVQVLRDPLLGGVARGRAARSTEERLRALGGVKSPAIRQDGTPRPPDPEAPGGPTSWDPVSDIGQEGAPDDQRESEE